MSAPAAEKLRDAARSRGAILAAAERLFAEHGYDRTSLSDIGTAAGLSRGSPSYLFGSKAEIYDEVLRAAFEARQAATSEAFAPVIAWSDRGAGSEGLRRALHHAASGYIRFLLEHPDFVALIMREELEHTSRMPAASRGSTAMRDAFKAIRRNGRGRGVGAFRVEEAVLLFVALTFGPVSYRRTLLPAQDVDLGDEAAIRRYVRLVVDQMMHFLCA